MVGQDCALPRHEANPLGGLALREPIRIGERREQARYIGREVPIRNARPAAHRRSRIANAG